MRTLLITCFTLLCLAACKKGKKEDPPPPPPGPAPARATLVFPGKDEACTSGTVVSPAENVVTFKWNAAANAESYELAIKDLESNAKQTKVTSQTELAVTLPRNKPYGWAVTSKSTRSTETAQSDVWKFFNAGPGSISYPPFPAELLTPAFGTRVTAGQLTLDWNGADADNDLTSYEVYFGTSASPPVFRTNVAESQLAAVPVTGNTTYYWMVVTKDAKGNSSRSEVYHFEVQ